MAVNTDCAHEKALASLAEFLKDDASIEQQRAELQLEMLVERYTMLLDTSAVLHAQFPAFARNVAPMLKSAGKSVLLPTTVIRDLKTLGIGKLDLRDRIRDACDALQMLQEEGGLRLCGDERGGATDKTILMMVNQYCTEPDLLVITQDCCFSRDLLQLSELESVSGRMVSVFRVTRYGYLTRYLSAKERHMESVAESACAVWPSKPSAYGSGMVQTEVCLDCGRHFVITQEQAERFRAHGLILPKRCYPCRQARRQIG